MSNYKSYYYKSLGLKEDALPGGKGDETKEDRVNPEQLQMGIKVEMEHTHDPNLSREIALDHLSEDPQYYTNLKNAGMADELPNGSNGETKPKLPMMQKLFSPTAIMPTPVIAVGVRGTKTGLLPAGGIVDDPEKARLGGLELVKNLKPNSQGAIANTPSSDTIKSDGGHYTPDNKEITKGKAPVTNIKGEDTIHPMQVQQLGNEPFKDDGTTRDGEHTPPAAGGDEKPCPTVDKEKEEPEDEEPNKGPWGIDINDEDDEDDEEEGEVNIDIKETLKEAQKQGADPVDKRIAKMMKNKKDRPFPFDKDHPELAPKANLSYGGKHVNEESSESTPMRERFQQLANIQPTDEAGALSELEELVGRLNKKGKVTPLLEKAQKYLEERKKKQ